ncbi:hypothetical protein EV131_1367 [Rhizobium laguerreae]|uniref:Uncharacterized protein n=1 Tax=Rhizobium laguerreae TaxID=1076926 RepID=A0AAX2QB90_9HYPH|nr:hypothetical protein EV131_1367 [Rhizobium laguerreae]
MEERRSLVVATGGFATCPRQRVDTSDGRDDGKLYCGFVLRYVGIPPPIPISDRLLSDQHVGDVVRGHGQHRRASCVSCRQLRFVVAVEVESVLPALRPKRSLPPGGEAQGGPIGSDAAWEEEVENERTRIIEEGSRRGYRPPGRIDYQWGGGELYAEPRPLRVRLRLSRREHQLVSHTREFGQGSGTHLLHDLAAVNLHGNLAHA